MGKAARQREMVGLDSRLVSASTETATAKSARPQRTVLVAATPGMVSESLLRALESEFPWVAVEQVETVEAACMDFFHPVALILMDSPFLEAAERAEAELLRQHPAALVAVMMPDYPEPVFELPHILNHSLVRAVLPMNVKLDVWLGVVELLLRGGDYFPATMFHSYVRKINAGFEGRNGAGAVPTAPPPIQIAELTAREVQILELVSRGLQNKTIAADLGLSEHTVKIHLHNIISKLGTHNRTEAAARFRDHQQSRLVPPAGGRDA